MWPAACGWAIVKGRRGMLKVIEQGGGRDADRIKDFSSVPMKEVARPLCQSIQSLCAKGHGFL